MNFIKFHSEKNFIISGVCLVRSLSRQEFVFPEFVFPEFVFPEFVFQEFVTAPALPVGEGVYRNKSKGGPIFLSPPRRRAKF